MHDRLSFLIAYVGSAAVVAFLAACLSSSRVATYRCDSTFDGAQRCELAATLAVIALGPDGVPLDSLIGAETAAQSAMPTVTPADRARPDAPPMPND